MQPHFFTVLYTSLAMIAFASNSLLNRLALGQESIDAVSYTTIRLTAGALTLWLISSLQKNNKGPRIRGNWISAAMLFLYAITFSLVPLSQPERRDGCADSVWQCAGDHDPGGAAFRGTAAVYGVDGCSAGAGWSGISGTSWSPGAFATWVGINGDGGNRLGSVFTARARRKLASSRYN